MACLPVSSRTVPAALALCLVMATALLLSACANMSPEAMRLGTNLLVAVGQNYGGKYYQEVADFYSMMNTASNNALEQSLQTGMVADSSGSQGVERIEDGADDDYGADDSADYADYADYVDYANDGDVESAYADGAEALEAAADEAVSNVGSDGDWGAAEPSPSASGSDDGVAIALDVAIMKRVERDGREEVVVLENGAIVYGAGSSSEGSDQLQVFFRPNVDSWIYVVAVDATGWVQPMFPSSFPDDQNPVLAHSTTLIPGDGYWFGLDGHVGTEHIYFVASRERLPDLEAKLARFAEQERPESDDAVAVTVPAVVEQAFISTRGFTGIRPGEATTYGATPTTFSFGVPNSDLVVTKFLDHR